MEDFKLKGTIPTDRNFIAASVMYTYNHATGEYTPYDPSLTKTKVSAIKTGKLLVGTTAVQAPDIECTWVVFMNQTDGSVVYFGSDDTVTPDNGFGALNYMDVVEPMYISNFNLVHLVSTQPNTDIRYLIGI